MLVRPLVLFAAAAALVLPGRREPVPQAADFRITDLRAHLFYSDRGTLSENILGESPPSLWNTIIGEGEAGGASRATLMVVEVTAPRGSSSVERRVELAVSTGGKEIYRRQQHIGLLSDDGRGYVAFMLYDTGCQPLRVSTALLGQADPSRRVAHIPFRCGE